MHNINDIIPDTIKRTCSGWIAISPKACGLKIGVIAESEKDAKIKFSQAFSGWISCLEKNSHTI